MPHIGLSPGHRTKARPSPNSASTKRRSSSYCKSLQPSLGSLKQLPELTKTCMFPKRAIHVFVEAE